VATRYFVVRCCITSQEHSGRAPQPSPTRNRFHPAVDKPLADVWLGRPASLHRALSVGPRHDQTTIGDAALEWLPDDGLAE
jgi:hypothetical protein